MGEFRVDFSWEWQSNSSFFIKKSCEFQGRIKGCEGLTLRCYDSGVRRWELYFTPLPDDVRNHAVPPLLASTSLHFSKRWEFMLAIMLRENIQSYFWVWLASLRETSCMHKWRRYCSKEHIKRSLQCSPNELKHRDLSTEELALHSSSAVDNNNLEEPILPSCSLFYAALDFSLR